MVEEIALRKVGERVGLGREEVDALLSSLRSSDLVEEAQRALALVGLAGEALGKAPEQARSVLAPLVAQVLAPAVSGDGGRLERVAEAAALLKAVLSDDQSKRAVEEVRQAVEALVGRLEELQKAREEEERQRLSKALDDLTALVASLQERVEQLSRQPAEQAQREAESLSERVRRLRREAEELAEALQLLGFRVEQGAQPAPTPEELAKELEKYGYRVERVVVTPDELKRMLEERERELRERLARELEVDKVRIQQVGGILRDIIKEIAGEFARAYAEAQKEAVRLRLAERARGAQLAGQGGEAGGGEG